MKNAGKFRNSVVAAGQLAAVSAVALGLCFAGDARAQGGFDGPGLYEISNVKSGKLLDLDRNGQSKAIQFSSQGSESQIWEVRAAGSGFLTLHNSMSGGALEANGTKNSQPVRATRFVGGSSQQWRLETAKDGSAIVVSRSGKTLDIAGASTNDGAVLQTYERNGDANQRFTFRMVSGSRAGGSLGVARPILSAAAAPATPTDGRTALKPGWNMFSAEQDVELGQQAALEAEQQVPLLNDARVDNYLNGIGRRLAAKTPGPQFPYTYKAVNDRSINAFALPGGRMYVNRGTIEAATSEAQLAGVMAHEASHVALRHGTNQASKASVAQMPLAILGGVLGGNSSAAALAQLGAGFTVNSILLKYSRDAESQADLLGTQILYDAGYDPQAMGQFFETLQAQDGGGNRVAFFNSHPNPDRRVDNVNAEVARLGGVPRGSTSTSREFDEIKRYVQNLPAPRANQLAGTQQPSAGSPAGGTSERYTAFENAVLRIDHPESWQAYGQGDAVSIAPNGGLVDDGRGNRAMAYGVVVNIYEPHAEQDYRGQLQGPGYGKDAGIPIATATDQLIQDLRQSNQNLRVVRRHESIAVSGQRGLSTYLSNDSPAQGGGRETNWLVTLPHAEGVLFFVFTAPEREFQGFENDFQRMLSSVRVKQ